MTHTSYKEFETLDWLPVTERFNQCINLIVFKYVNDQRSNYIQEVSQTAPENNIQSRDCLKVKNALSAKQNFNSLQLFLVFLFVVNFSS